MFNRLINTRPNDAYEVRQTANEMAASLSYPDYINNGKRSGTETLITPAKGG